jgi:hypothetical protein
MFFFSFSYKHILFFIFFYLKTCFILKIFWLQNLVLSIHYSIVKFVFIFDHILSLICFIPKLINPCLNVICKYVYPFVQLILKKLNLFHSFSHFHPQSCYQITFFTQLVFITHEHSFISHLIYLKTYLFFRSK